jgi:hypothetical protein
MSLNSKSKSYSLLTKPLAILLGFVTLATVLAGCIPAPPPGSSSSPSGYLDVVTGGNGNVRVEGWASDWDTLDPIQVVFVINGEWISGGFNANKPRTDVGQVFGRGNNFGFDETFEVAAGPVTVCAGAINVGPGEPTFLGCGTSQVSDRVTVEGESPTPPTTVPPPTTTIPAEPTWRTVANHGDNAPGVTATFNSYNQPAVNSSGLVAFRARTKGEGARGVYSKNPVTSPNTLNVVADVKGGLKSFVPAPNTQLAEFNEFPSVPRIGRTSNMIATRGQSVPVLSYTPEGGVETKVGTSGIYATVNGTLTSGATLLGAVPGYDQFAVPGVTPATKFDQFPGSPAVDGSTVVFKGNYAVGDTSQTGVFFRNVAVPADKTKVIANSSTLIPNQPAVGGAPGTVTFGSTAPPSATGGRAVFTGLDVEDAPTLGGVYLAPIASNPTLTPLVSIGDQVPIPDATPADRFTAIGEGLSFDGRFVTFWGTWGAKTPITLDCPEDGNADLLAFCNTTYPDGFTTDVSIHQGTFVHDTTTGVTKAVATSDSEDPDALFSGFQYWTFSGKPPTDGVGGGDASQELPRWRSSAFAAVTGSGSNYTVAFKANRPSGTSGIYLAQGPTEQPILTVVDTNTAGPVVDTEAPADTLVTSVGMERDGLNGRYLALNLGMANADASVSWGGIYLVSTDRLTAIPVVKEQAAPKAPQSPAAADGPHSAQQLQP